MTENKPKMKIVLSNEEVDHLLEICPEFKKSIIEAVGKVFDEAIENAKREAGTAPNKSG